MVETIRIPERFKEGLKRRFDLRKVQRLSVIDAITNKRKFLEGFGLETECPLCSYYKNGRLCGRCPFAKGEFNCIDWIRELLGFRPEVNPFTCGDKKILIARLKTLRKEAQNYIIWEKEDE